MACQLEEPMARHFCRNEQDDEKEAGRYTMWHEVLTMNGGGMKMFGTYHSSYPDGRSTDDIGSPVDREAILTEVRRIARDILGECGPRLYLYGSFARCAERPSSDIDLAVEADYPVPRALLADLRQCYEESNIPYRVEVVDLFTSAPEFSNLVREGGILWED